MMLKRICTSILLLALFQSCKQEEPALFSPSIETISFAGIAPQDVELNQTLRSVIITTPATLMDAKLKTTLQLTPHTEIVSGLLPDGTLDLSNYCPCTNFGNGKAMGRATQEIVLRNTTDGRTESYWLILKTKNPVVIKSSATPLIYSIGDKSMSGVIVPVENYYGSQPVVRYQLTNTVTGQSAYTSGDGGCLSNCSPVGINRMAIYLNFFLRDFSYGFGPGTYAVKFTLEDGTMLTVPQPIQIVL